MKMDIRQLEAPITRLDGKWQSVPAFLRRMGLPIGFIGFIGLTGLVMLWMARGRLFDFWGAIFFAAAMVLLLGGIALNLPGFLRGVLEYLSPRRSLYGTQVIIVVVLAFVVLTFANYLASRHYSRWDLSPEKVFTLDERTRSLLAKVDELSAENGDMVMYYLYDPSPDPYSGYNLHDKMDDLLSEYAARCKHIKVHTYNYASLGDRERMLNVLREMKIEPNAASLNWVLITYKGQRKDLKQTDLLEPVNPYENYGQPPKPPKFKGEDAISSAVRDLINTNKIVCYFLAGHGERDVTPGIGNLSTLMENLRGLNMEVKPLNLPEERKIPADANVIIIADPRSPKFLPEEIELLKTFVQNMHGNVIVLGEPYKVRKNGAPSGIEEFLLNYGIKLREEFMVLQLQPVLGAMQFNDTVAATQFGQHPSTAALTNGKQAVLFSLPCLIELTEPKDAAYETKYLVKAVNTVGKVTLDNEMPSAAKGDINGPLMLAAVSQPKNATAQLGKVAAFADCDFVGDGDDMNFKGPGLDLVINVVSSFTGRTENLGIADRAPTERFIMLLPTSQSIFYYGFVIALPLAVVMSGIFVLLIRRK